MYILSNKQKHLFEIHTIIYPEHPLLVFLALCVKCHKCHKCTYITRYKENEKYYFKCKRQTNIID